MGYLTVTGVQPCPLPIRQWPPRPGGGIEPLEPRDELRGAGEPGGVERLLELAGEPDQLFRVGEPLRLRFEGLLLADARLGPLDLLDHVTQVVGLTLDLLAARQIGRAHV